MNAVAKTHWKVLVNPDYMGAYSLPEGQDVTVTILSVGREMVKGEGGKKEECTVAQIKGNKPLILNRTNCKSIEKLYGSPYIEDWAGKQITLFATTTKVAGETVACLRIRPKVAERTKATLTDERLDKAIESIQTGQFTLEKLMARHELTEAQQAKLHEVFGNV